MAFQGFSPKLHVAMDLAKAKKAGAASPIDHAEKVRRKKLADARNEKRLAENLAQRALVQSRRGRSA